MAESRDRGVGSAEGGEDALELDFALGEALDFDFDALVDVAELREGEGGDGDGGGATRGGAIWGATHGGKWCRGLSGRRLVVSYGVWPQRTYVRRSGSPMDVVNEARRCGALTDTSTAVRGTTDEMP